MSGRVFQAITAEHGVSRPYHRVYINGKLEPALDYTWKADRDHPPIKAAGDFILGRYTSAIPHYLNGDLAEVLVYDTILSEETRKRIESYLISKYVGR
ncbi:MAG: LamG domain-containing protein [Acidobacteria bacterium]|nr:LamG domain-containing protein [Acidobacteriota bacterium]MCI0722307.1 LamG domain-containing protein [Acidobacteriota bacterium]